MALECLVDAGAADAPVLLLLHGRGSDERDLLPLGRELHPTATIVSVRAPFPAAPWGYGPGWAWYRFIADTTPEAESFVAGQEALAGFVRDDLAQRIGRAPSSLFMGGFSQGGTSSLAFALRNPGVLSGVMVFSGFVANHPSVDVARIGATPVWWGHGTADPAIPYRHGESGWRALRAASADLTTETREGMGHSIDRVELAAAAAWLRARA